MTEENQPAPVPVIHVPGPLPDLKPGTLIPLGQLPTAIQAAMQKSADHTRLSHHSQYPLAVTVDVVGLAGRKLPVYIGAMAN